MNGRAPSPAGSTDFTQHSMRGSTVFRDFYGWMLTGILRHRILTPAVAAVVVIGAGVLALFVGTDFFPSVDAGLIQLHVRAPARTRIERTEQISRLSGTTFELGSDSSRSETSLNNA
jgi:multidrug efflux pump subunit AcrB